MAARVTNDVQAHNYVISPGTEKTAILSQCPLRRVLLVETRNYDSVYEISHVL